MLTLGLLLASIRISASAGARAPAFPRVPFQKGMALADHVGRHDHPQGVESARRLRALGCDWIQISPFAFQKDVARPEISFSDFTATQTAYLDSLRMLGFHVLLKPDIWSRQFWSGEVWRGDIRMASEEDWRAWFREYREYLLHYAKLAENERIEMFCIGLEYSGATVERPEDWRALIREVRTVYSGPITYAAHWPAEAESISFWDELDAVGVNLYPDLSEAPVVSANALDEAWKPVVARLQSLSKKWRKPIVLTEMGFSSTVAAANDPWRWIQDHEPVSEIEQAHCYEAAFRALWERPWLRGIYWWKWYIEPDAGGPLDNGFTPQGKEASQVIARWYASARDRAD
jgi:hypothetical protein